MQPVAEVENEARFRLLETVREFAADQLSQCGEIVETSNTHARIYLLSGQAAASHLRSEQQATWFDTLERDHPNLIAALTWFRSQDELEPALDWQVNWAVSGRCEAISLKVGAGSVSSYLRLTRCRTVQFRLGYEPRQRSGPERSPIGNPITWSLIAVSSALRGFQETGDEWGVAFALLNLGQAATYRGDLSAASGSFRRVEIDLNGLAMRRTSCRRRRIRQSPARVRRHYRRGASAGRSLARCPANR